MTTVSERLNGSERPNLTRRTYRHRGDAKTGTDISYTVYAAVLIVLIVGFPVIRALVVVLAEPAILSGLQASAASDVVGVVCGLLLTGFAALGQVRGPVALSPFFVTLLAGTDLPRSRTLLRPLATMTSIAVGISLAVSMLISGVLVFAGTASVVSGMAFVIACASFSLVGCFVWLASQRTIRRSWILPVALLGATVIAGVLEPARTAAPWGWVGALWPAEPSPPAWPLILLCITAIACWAFTPRLLNSLSSTSLLEQGERWQSAGTAAVAGDFASALGGFRAKPTVGRVWTAVTRHTVFVRFLLRDLLGALRTPGGFLTGAAFLVLAYSTSDLAFTSTALPGWLSAAVGSAVGYLALGVLSDGFRHAAETAGTSPLYGYSTVRLYLLHAILPATASLIAAAFAIAVAAQAGAHIALIAAVGTVSVLLVIVRAYDSAKGPLPVLLMTPVPTPAGDLAVLVVLGWQSDALLIATVAGSAIISMAAAGRDLNALMIAVVVAGVVLVLLRRRLRRL